MSAAHFPRSILSPAKLEKLIVLNTDPQGVEFRLPSPEDCPNNVSLPWVSFFENHIDSGMRILPAPCFLDLAKIYTVPLNQFNPYSLHRATAPLLTRFRRTDPFYSFPEAGSFRILFVPTPRQECQLPCPEIHRQGLSKVVFQCKTYF